MPDYCSAFGCSNQRCRQTRSRGITFHRYPRDSSLRRQWDLAVKREGFASTVRSVLCSDHFKTDDFDRTGQIVRLRPGAKPSVFHLPSCLPKQVSRRRKKTLTKAEEGLPVDVHQHFSKAEAHSILDHNYALLASSTLPTARLNEGLVGLGSLESEKRNSMDREQDFKEENIIKEELKDNIGFPADVPDGVSCKHGLQLQDHLHIKKEEEELWESVEEKQETDITAVRDEMKELKKEIMTQQSQEAKQTDREPEEKLEIKALLQTKRIPANILCGDSSDGLQLQDHLHIKKEEEELWESVEEKQETDITAVTVKSEDEEEEAQCSLLHWRQSEENIKGEPATCSSAKLLKVEPHGDVSEGPEAANTCSQPDSDGEETDCSDTEDSEDWREPLSQSEAQSEHMDMSWDSFQSSEVSTENNTRDTPHTREKPFGCDMCEKKFTNKRSIFAHRKIHTGEKPFGCDVCGQTFIHKASLSRHVRIHSGEKPFACDVCGKVFNSSSDMKRHVRIHAEGKHFGCDVCGKVFNSSNYMKRHIRTHTEGNPFGCDVCGKRFITELQLMNHMRIHTVQEPFGCDECGKRFSNRYNLKIHARMHTGEKPFHCDVCGQSLIHKTSLSRHMRIHSGEKPFGCDICGQTFILKPSLSRHMRIHSGEKPFGCDVCEKRFSNKPNLKNHMRIHTGEKPFSCEVCGKNFHRNQSLKRHMIVHSGEEPIGCDVCV